MLRRLVTIPAVWLGTALLTSLLPALLPLALVVDLLRGRWKLPSLRVLLFGLCFGWIESLGIWSLAAVGLFTLGRPAARLELTFAVQRRYTAALFRSVCSTLSLKFDVDGDSLADAGPLVVWVRHTSIVDTLVPGVFLAGAHGLRLRYVLKRELRWGPCLDIAGAWLPNHFVSRDGVDSEKEIWAVGALKSGLGPGEGVLLYPEGTRFTESKRARALAKMTPALRAPAERLRHLMPPRLGGTLALLRAEPKCDVLVIGHRGLEGFASVRDIWAGTLVGGRIEVKFFRLPAAQIPAEHDAQVAFVYEAWQRLDDWLGR